MSALNPTPADKLIDERGLPYFLWDCEMTLSEFRRLLQGGTAAERAYLTGKLMRQAKPDDVFTFLSVADVRDRWPAVERYLGRSKPFWRWLLERWGVFPNVAG